MEKNKGEPIKGCDLSALIWCDILHFYYRDMPKCLCGQFNRRSYQTSGERIAKVSEEMDFLLAQIDRAKENFEEYCTSSEIVFIKKVKIERKQLASIGYICRKEI